MYHDCKNSIEQDQTCNTCKKPLSSTSDSKRWSPGEKKSLSTLYITLLGARNRYNINRNDNVVGNKECKRTKTNVEGLSPTVRN